MFVGEEESSAAADLLLRCSLHALDVFHARRERHTAHICNREARNVSGSRTYANANIPSAVSFKPWRYTQATGNGDNHERLSDRTGAMGGWIEGTKATYHLKTFRKQQEEFP